MKSTSGVKGQRSGFRPIALMRRGRTVASLTLLLAPVLSVVAFGSPSSEAASPTGTTTLFSSSTPGFTASAASVPLAICFVTVSASGGAGGGSDVAGGTGATVTARLLVTPGEALDVVVAGSGGIDSSGVGGQGGFGGGGGGNGPGGGGGGGGASVVTTSAGTPLVVAGGGGGAADGITPGNAGTLGNSGGSGDDSTGGSATGAGGASPLIGGGGGVTTGGIGPDGDNGGGGNATATVGGGGGSTGGAGGTGGAGSGQGGIGGTSESGHLAGGNGGMGTGSGGNGANANAGPLTSSYFGTENGAGGGGGNGFGGGAGSGGGGGYGGGGPAAGGSSYVTPSATQAVSSSGNLGGGSVQISYDTTTDTCPPTTSVLIPSQSTTLSGSTDLDASASNATSVEFLLYGGSYGFNAPVVCIATPTLYGWLCDWNTTTVPNGSFELVSKASGSGGTSFSSGIGITVKNPPPVTSVLIPSSGATLSGSTDLDASATDAASVWFLLFGGIYGFSGSVLCTATPSLYGWLCDWNTTTVPNGSYVLVSEAFNSSGSTYSSGVSITVNN